MLAIFAGLQWWRSDPLASGDAPPLTGTLIGADQFDLQTLRGSAVLVHFWAAWCPVCQLGDDSIDAIAKDFKVITIAMQSGGAKEISAHLRNEGFSFPVIADPYAEIASRWGVTAVPASFVIDPAGHIKFATLGHTTEAGLRARLWASKNLE